jgi:cytochrome c biogenesis protein CcmG/thiol:disulfide interchange protein DsbE
MSGEAPAAGPRAGWGRFLPLALFLVLAGLFAGYLIATRYGYERDTLPSALIGRPAPATELPPLDGRPGEGLSAALLNAPGVKLVNVWASWCGPCRIEHPHLMALQARGVVVHGINYRDEPSAARGFLAELGDPYVAVGADRTGRAGVEWGVYGVPETFVIDGAGRIAFKHVGPIQNDDLDRLIVPAIRAAGGTVAD